VPSRRPSSRRSRTDRAADLEPGASVARAARVRTAPQPPSSSSGHRECPTAVSAARADHRSRHADTSAHSPTRSSRRTPPRIRPSCLTCANGIFGIRRAVFRAQISGEMLDQLTQQIHRAEAERSVRARARLHDDPTEGGGEGSPLIMGSSFRLCPRQDSNLRFRLRRATLYPLSYGGSGPTRSLAGPPEPTPNRSPARDGPR
jgi:hypothetical protein